MNVLLTTAGRRSYLVRWFQEALEGGGRVLASNSIECPAFYVADDSFISPLIRSDDYIPFLLELCKREQVDLVVPLFDLDVVAISQHRDAFAAIGAIPVVPSAEVAALCLDKLLASRHLSACGISAPHTFGIADAWDAYRAGELRLPAIVKHRSGRSSLGISIVRDGDELETACFAPHRGLPRSIESSLIQVSDPGPDRELVVQELVFGQEYGLDVICDLEGSYVTTIVKRKLGMRAGETDASVTVDLPDLQAIGERLARALPHPGNLDVDLIMSEDGPQVLDVNPRFGGGYPFSHAAGCNLPQALVRWRAGLPVGDELLTATPGVASYKDISVMVAGKAV